MQWKQTSKQRTGIEKETKKSFFWESLSYTFTKIYMKNT